MNTKHWKLLQDDIFYLTILPFCGLNQLYANRSIIMYEKKNNCMYNGGNPPITNLGLFPDALFSCPCYQTTFLENGEKMILQYLINTIKNMDSSIFAKHYITRTDSVRKVELMESAQRSNHTF